MTEPTAAFKAFPTPEQGPRVRVLMVGDPKPPGGMATIISEMAGSSISNKVQMTLFDNGKRTAASRSLWQGVRSQLQMLREYVGLMRRERPHIVHLHSGGRFDFYRYSPYVFIARLMRAKVVFHNHLGAFESFYNSQGPLRRAYIRFTLGRCQSVPAFSQWWKDFYSKITRPSHVHVLYNAIKADAYENNTPREKARELLQIPRDCIVVLVMGVKCRNKGSYDIIDAAPAIARSNPAVRLVLVGPDEWSAKGTNEEMARLCRERQLDGMVDIRGHADETLRFLHYAAADIFMLPSYSEGAPMTVIEAMAAALPVISTPVGAIPEMVDDGRTGMLIQPGKPEQIAAAVLKLAGSETLRRQMGEAGHAKFREMFDIERVLVPALWKVYEELARKA